MFCLVVSLHSIEIPYMSPSEDFITHLSSPGIFTKTYVLWQADTDSSLPKDEKRVTGNISSGSRGDLVSCASSQRKGK